MYSLSYKQEFRDRFGQQTGLFSSSNWQPAYFTNATVENFQRIYNTFVSAYPYTASVVNAQRSEGIGSGELIAYFIFNNVTIGGKNAPCDAYTNGMPFAEFKSGRYSSASNSMYDFKLGKDSSLSSEQIVKELGNVTASALNTVDIKIVARWKERVHVEMLGTPAHAFIDTRDLRMRHFGPLTKDMVDLYRIHRLQPWVRVHLPRE